MAIINIDEKTGVGKYAPSVFVIAVNMTAEYGSVEDIKAAGLKFDPPV